MYYYTSEKLIERERENMIKALKKFDGFNERRILILEEAKKKLEEIRKTKENPKNSIELLKQCEISLKDGTVDYYVMKYYVNGSINEYHLTKVEILPTGMNLSFTNKCNDYYRPFYPNTLLEKVEIISLESFKNIIINEKII